ncbi:hypothetical protein RYX36_035108, partial [Vicia faba]
MGENPGSGSQYVAVGESASPKATNHMRKVSVLPLVFLIFYEVSGGPFGVEDTVKAAGPLLALLGFLVFPFIWSVPEALITAEMGTMFPENSGYVVWVSTALGPFWGFQQGWMKWLSGVIDNALLDLGNGKTLDLERCSRSKLRKQCIKYLGPQERENYEYVVCDGKIINNQSGDFLHTKKDSEDAKWIFVMSTEKKLYAGKKKKGLFHHSSFLAGGATLAAGRLEAEDGVLK